MRAFRAFWVSLAVALLCCALAPMALAEVDTEEGSTAADAAVPAAPRRPPMIQFRPQDNWVMESCALAFLAILLINLFIGRRRNERLALRWTTEVRPCASVSLPCVPACPPACLPGGW